MNIEDIFPEIYKQVNEDKGVLTSEIVARNIYNSPYFSYIEDKIEQINANVRNYDPKVQNQGDIIKKFVYDNFLFHGTETLMGDIKYLEFRERTEPKDTNVFIHNYINNLSKKKYGVNVRNGMFVTTQVKSAKSYGSPYIIFPLGEYKIFYSLGVTDFTDGFSAASHGEFGGHFTSYILDNMAYAMGENNTFKNNVEDSVYGFFGYVTSVLDDEQFKTFKEFKQRVIEECEEYLKEVISNHDNFDRVLNSIKRTLGTIINNYMGNIKRYVDKIEETQDPSDLKKYEAMLFFKHAYAIDYQSEFMVDVFLELIELI